MSVVEPIPALIQSRRRLASELLTAAARHSAIVDEIHDLELIREERTWTEALSGAATECPHGVYRGSRLVFTELA